MSSIEVGEVESGVPISEAKPGRPKLIPYDEMDVGDSVLIECRGTRDERSRIMSSIRHQKIKHGGDFAVRKVDGGFRVWRTAH